MKQHLTKLELTILLLVIAWMFWAAGQYTVFDDEAFSCQRYVLPMGEMLRGLRNGVEPDPPLYYVLENLSLRSLGVGPVAIRFLSIAAFVLGLLFMRATATEAWGARMGIATMLLCAIHPAHLFFGFAARWYSTMFLAVAVLLYASLRLVQADQASARRLTILWSLAATAVLYTNYFGVVVVGMIWLAAMIRIPDKKRLIASGILAALLFAPWLPPFWRQATAFPKFSGSAGSMLATAARTTMALLAGDLASPRAWWVWGPMGVFVVLVLTLLVQNRRRMGLITFVVAGCFIAGVVSRTMIDKYVMTFSGIFCLWLARLLTKDPDHSNGRKQRLRISAITALTVAWLGCGYNLITERYWSSLRWLDPFDMVTSTIVKEYPEGTYSSHPSAGYYQSYHALHLPMSFLIGDEKKGELHHTSESPPQYFWPSAEIVRYVLKEQNGRGWPGSDLREATIRLRKMIERVRAHRPPPALRDRTASLNKLPIVTIETSEYSDSTGWEEFRHLLDEHFEMTAETKYLQDPDAAWKDRLDPEYRHPRWRIVVRYWRLK